ncbi:MAG: hypothetical protein MUP63_03765 [Candidatus Nanohaloarchaeota archaeon QJJ-7]|nr:hypothetical protein [Candidatus Nanohaloarchaeota archaeon QJJ-7]
MAIEEALISLVQGNNLLMFILLIALFLVAYRVLKAVINTAIVAVLSGAFLVVLDFLRIGPEATLSRFMMFMVMGSALFILFSAFKTLVRTTNSVLEAFKKIFSKIFKPLRHGEKEEKEKEIILEELKDE